MAAEAQRGTEEAPRLTLAVGALLVAATLALFAAAYAAGGLFGRAADEEPGAGDGRAVLAVEPSGTPDLTLHAGGVAFNASTLTVPADRPVLIRLENGDAGILHNIAVYRDAQASDLVARGRLFDGPRTRDYRFAGFPAGRYYFQCDLHPAMNGTLVAE